MSETRGIYLPIHDIKTVYMEIPKTGCTSIKHSLSSYLLPPCQISVIQSDVHYNMLQFMKKDYEELMLMKEQGYCIFSFVRNPYTRLASLWVNLKNNEFRENFDFIYPYKKGMSYKSFVRKITRIPDEDSNLHFAGQSYILSFDDSFIPTIVGKFENIEYWWNNIMGESASPLLNLNSNVENSYLDLYDEELAELVYNRYNDDFQRWYK